MKNKAKLLECLFGHHQYDDKVTKDKDGRSVRLCTVCKRKALWCWYDYTGDGSFVEYDSKGNSIRVEVRNGFKLVRNKDGKWVEVRRSAKL